MEFVGFVALITLLNFIVAIKTISFIEYLQEAWADSKRRQREAEANTWFGEMRCICGYSWTSRKSTPPARCPRCNLTYITAELGR